MTPIEKMAQQIAATRTALEASKAKQDKAKAQVKVWSEAADKAGEEIALLTTRLGTLAKQIVEDARG